MGDDPFADMSHEEMLAWLDKANPSIVQAGADKLLAAAREIEKIATELKTRPQYVEWKGQGADSFRAWGGDLANATLRIADYSTDSGNFLSHVADAIARTKSSIPRDDGGAQADIDAAKATPNDPDAAKALARATAQKEAVRQQAADEMTKLGQAYDQSAERLTALTPPKVPPPPDAIVPKDSKNVSSERNKALPGSTTGSASSGAVSGAVSTGHTGTASSGKTVHTPQSTATGHGGEASTGRAQRVEPVSVPHTDIDSVATLPDTRTPVPSTGATPPGHGPVSSGPSTPTVPVPPLTSGTRGRTGIGPGARLPAGPSANAGQGRTVGTARPLGQGTGRPLTGTPGFSEGRTAPVAGRTSASTPYGRNPDGSGGIYGGRPSQPQVGRATPYRGTVVGGEPEDGRGPGGRTVSGTQPGGRTVPGAQPGGRALPGPQAGGRSGPACEPGVGRSATGRGQTPAGQRASVPSRGVIGAPPPQRAARTVAGERAVPGRAALSSDGIAGGSASARRGGKARTGTGGAPTSSPPRRRKEEHVGERPGFVTEDEETWPSDRRRTVPPTVD
ncbi:WXG100 family type VII secretion target [Streptomyces sp. YIM S03343]